MSKGKLRVIIDYSSKQELPNLENLERKQAEKMLSKIMELTELIFGHEVDIDDIDVIFEEEK